MSQTRPRRRRRPRGDQRPGDGGRGRPGAPATPTRCTGSPTAACRSAARCIWDVLGIHREVLAGIARGRAAPGGRSTAIGIDSWAVDYGLLDRDGELLGEPVPATATAAPTASRELVAQTRRRGRAVRRQRAAAAAVQHASTSSSPPAAPRARGGRHAAAAARPARLLADRRGRRRAHQRLHHRAARRARTGEWSSDLAAPARRSPGRSCRRCATPARSSAPLRAEVAAGLGVAATSRSSPSGRTTPRRPWSACRRRRTELRLHLVGHLVAGRPRARRPGAHRGRAAGRLHQRGRRRRHDPLPQERDGPVGALGVRCARGRTAATRPPTSHALLAGPARPRRCAPSSTSTTPRCSVPAAPRTRCPSASSAWPARPASRCPQTPGEITRCVLDSLALAYRRHLRTAARAGRARPRRRPRRRRRRHNHLLCQLTADALGLPVLAGPGRGRRARQRPRPGARPRCRPARPRRHACPRPRDARRPPSRPAPRARLGRSRRAGRRRLMRGCRP